MCVGCRPFLTLNIGLSMCSISHVWLDSVLFFFFAVRRCCGDRKPDLQEKSRFPKQWRLCGICEREHTGIDFIPLPPSCFAVQVSSPGWTLLFVFSFSYFYLYLSVSNSCLLKVYIFRVFCLHLFKGWHDGSLLSHIRRSLWGRCW